MNDTASPSTAKKKPAKTAESSEAPVEVTMKTPSGAGGVVCSVGPPPMFKIAHGESCTLPYAEAKQLFDKGLCVRADKSPKF